ncbi:hypothetical protein CsSME_00036064 [Camellia sinensis var. sinensis]
MLRWTVDRVSVEGLARMVLMVRLESDLAQVLLVACKGELSGVSLNWSSGSAMVVVMASNGYPGSYAALAVKIFHASTALDSDGNFIATEGHVLGVTAKEIDLQEARDGAYQAVEEVTWQGGFYRQDIGWRTLPKISARKICFILLTNEVLIQYNTFGGESGNPRICPLLSSDRFCTPVATFVFAYPLEGNNTVPFKQGPCPGVIIPWSHGSCPGFPVPEIPYGTNKQDNANGCTMHVTRPRVDGLRFSFVSQPPRLPRRPSAIQGLLAGYDAKPIGAGLGHDS